MFKLTVTPQKLITNTFAVGKKTVQFMPISTNNSSSKTVTSVQKLTSIVATSDVKDNEEVLTEKKK